MAKFNNADVIIALLVVLVVLIAWLSVDTMNQLDGCLYGFWSADTEFLESSGLDMYFMYIGAPKMDNNSYVGYMGARCRGHIYLRHQDGSPPINASFEAFVRRTNMRPNNITRMSFKFLTPSVQSYFPQKINLELDPVTGMLIISAGGKMYGRMFKKSEASYFCTSSPEQLKTEPVEQNDGAAEEPDSSDDDEAD